MSIVNTVVTMNKESGAVRLAELGRALGLDLKPLSRDVMRLVEAGVLRRDGDALIADIASLGRIGDSVVEMTALCQAIPPESPLRRYLVHGRIVDLPKRPEDLDVIAHALASLLPEDQTLSESEVNAILAHAGDDVARLRRLLADLGLVERSGSAEYRRPAAAPARAL
ncbi:hypothetical protein FHR32_008053 [Streptosporangium album]|uniref:DUF2087 domain-containing protein n=2 Tax=Streptosporangium TaxID=2000 RepID=A0A7W7S4B4_9ACTN|nr:DUF2087 domain-containing protein [Streptosporangium album]MBB4943653.1 hypothetical protein [Streptosporangium album]OUC97742.1 hypothetical protein CA984_10040 [Streptosporangium minutum]